MKEKTFKDLGLDEGDNYLQKIGEEYDLGDLLEDDKDDNEEKAKKIKDIKGKI